MRNDPIDDYAALPILEFGASLERERGRDPDVVKPHEEAPAITAGGPRVLRESGLAHDDRGHGVIAIRT